MAFLRNIATVGGLTLVSRALGFLRDILIAAFLGADLSPMLSSLPSSYLTFSVACSPKEHFPLLLSLSFLGN